MARQVGDKVSTYGTGSLSETASGSGIWRYRYRSTVDRCVRHSGARRNRSLHLSLKWASPPSSEDFRQRQRATGHRVIRSVQSL
jgi:hypothetical protein